MDDQQRTVVKLLLKAVEDFESLTETVVLIQVQTNGRIRFAIADTKSDMKRVQHFKNPLMAYEWVKGQVEWPDTGADGPQT